MIAAATLPPGAAWAALQEAGLTAALLPEDAGGFGIAPTDALGLLRVAGRHALALPLAEAMLGGWLLAQAGVGVPGGLLTVAPGAAATLHRVGGGWHVAGQAWGVAWGRAAAGVVLLLEHEGAAHVVLLPAGGWSIEPGVSIAGDPHDTIGFDTRADAAPAPLAPDALRAAGAATRVILIAGAIDAVLAMTVGYANDRTQFGKPIGRFQAVQQSLAVLAGHAAAAGAAADIAAACVVPAPHLLAIAAAKSRAGEAAGAAAAIAHQVHGAIGFTEEHALHRFTRRLWAWRDEYGTEAEWQRLLGRHLAAAGPERLWAALTEIGA